MNFDQVVEDALVSMERHAKSKFERFKLKVKRRPWVFIAGFSFVFFVIGNSLA